MKPYTSIYKESTVEVPEAVLESLQKYVDDNYNSSDWKNIVNFFKDNLEFSESKHLTLFRGYLFSGSNVLDNIITSDYFQDSLGSKSFTKDIREAEAFASGDTVYDYQGKKKGIVLLHDQEGFVAQVLISKSDILIDVEYCLRKGLLPEIEWIEENEVLTIPKNRKVKPIDAIDEWGWWSLTGRSLSKTKPKVVKPSIDELSKTIAYDIRSFQPSGYRYSDKQIIKDSQSNSVTVAVRHWGRWDLPQGSEGEEDFDWMELDGKDYKKAVDILTDFVKSKSWKSNVSKIYVTTEEKNWLHFIIEFKKSIKLNNMKGL